MNEETQPHDHLIRFLLSNQRHAAAYLQSVLPDELSKRLDFDKLESVDTAFITKVFKEKRTDILLFIPWKHRSSKQPHDSDSRTTQNGGGAFVYLLFEHQRRPDPLMPLRLLGYTVAIWERWLTRQKTKRGKLPPVIPLVLYQGQRSWNVGRDVLSMTDTAALRGSASREISTLLANQGYILHSLRDTPDDRIGPRGTVRVALVVMKHIDSPSLLAVLESLLQDMRWIAQRRQEDSLQDLRMILRYILLANERITTQMLAQVLEPLGNEAKETVMTEGQRLIEQGIRKGIQQGIQQGIQRGIQQGIQQGHTEKALSIARSLLAEGMTPTKVAKITELPLVRVLKLADES